VDEVYRLEYKESERELDDADDTDDVGLGGLTVE
jgi:hypothetical protein